VSIVKNRNLEELERRKRESELGGGEARIARQHAEGKLTARERIQLLFDNGSFQELDQLVVHRSTDFGMDKLRIPGDGVVTGYGMVQGRLVYAFAQDFTVFGGSLSETYAAKIVKIMDAAMKNGAPLIGLNDSGGARIQEGVVSLGGYADIFLRNTLASGVVPQISAIMGPCAGGAVYSPAITDFILMVKKTSYMFVTGPDVIRTVTHEEVTKEKLGGADTHNQISGVAHFAADSDEDCLATIRELLSFLPSNNLEEPPSAKTSDDINRVDAHLDELIPDSPNQPYEMRELIKSIADEGSSSTIVEAVVNIAAASNMTTTAEGVEQEWQREMLRKLGCPEMQGFLFSPAIPAAEIRRLLMSHQGRAVSAA